MVSLSSSYTWEFTTTCSRKEAVIVWIDQPPRNLTMKLILSFSNFNHRSNYTKQQRNHWFWGSNCFIKEVGLILPVINSNFWIPHYRQIYHNALTLNSIIYLQSASGPITWKSNNKCVRGPGVRKSSSRQFTSTYVNIISGHRLCVKSFKNTTHNFLESLNLNL